MAYLYRHIRLDKNEPFYIGVGGLYKFDNYKRAYNKNKRNTIWKHITDKTEYEVEIVLDDLQVEECYMKEIEFINFYGRIDLKTGTLSNLNDGGIGGNNRVVSEKVKEYLRNLYKGVPRPEHVRVAMNRSGKKHSYTSKIKISKSVSSKNNPFYGKHHTEEVKRKLSERCKLLTGSKNPFFKRKHNQTTLDRIRTKVINIETGIYYDSVLEASTYANINYSTFRAMLNGRLTNKTQFIQC